jgi:hypothetical protein
VTDPVLNDPAYLFAQQALMCLQSSYPVSGYAPGQYCVRVGLSVTYDVDMTLDLCCEGLGYVALGDTYPSSDSFPEADIIRQARAVCPPVAWAQQLKVGIIRCIPTVTDDFGAMPSCEDWGLAFRQNVADIVALRRMSCCLRTWLTGQTGLLLGMSLVIERQIQGSPQGGCVERSVTMSLQQPNCDC